METTPLRSGPVVPGDTIVFLGKPHVVEAVGRRVTGLGLPVAEAADGWSVALCPDGHLEIPCPNRACDVEYFRVAS